METMVVTFGAGGRDDAEALAAILNEEFGEEALPSSTEEELDRLAPAAAVVIVALAIVGVAGVVRVINWFQSRKDCLLVVDLRDGQLRIDERCDVVGQRGKTIIVSEDNTRVGFARNDSVLELDTIISEMMSGGVQALTRALSESGSDFETDPNLPNT